MKHSLPSLDALKVFEAAARHLSFSLAAEELCIGKGAVSYQIRKLEKSLDCALFKRSVRQVYLTDAGQQLQRATQTWFAELTRTFAKIKPEDSMRSVTVGVSTYVAMRWLSPRITGFSARNPDISIRLQHAVNSEDFRLQDVDFAICWGPMTGRTDRSRLLELPTPLFPACSPDLLRRHNHPPERTNLRVEELANSVLGKIPLLCEERRLDLWQRWYDVRRRPLPNPRRVVADANVRTQLAIDGQGWIMADVLTQRELQSGLLVTPFDHQLHGYGYAIQTWPGRYLNRAASEFGKWLLRRA